MVKFLQKIYEILERIRWNFENTLVKFWEKYWKKVDEVLWKIWWLWGKSWWNFEGNEVKSWEKFLGLTAASSLPPHLWFLPIPRKSQFGRPWVTCGAWLSTTWRWGAWDQSTTGQLDRRTRTIEIGLRTNQIFIKFHPWACGARNVWSYSCKNLQLILYWAAITKMSRAAI